MKKPAGAKARMIGRALSLGAAAGAIFGASLWSPETVGASSTTGTASMSADQIVSSALRAMQSLKSFSMTGVVHQGHQTIGISVDVSQSGEGQGSVVMNGYSVDIALTGSTVYMKAGTAFWHKSGLPAAVASQLSGRWISFPGTSQEASSIAGSLNGSSFLSQLPKTSDKGTVFAKVSAGTLGGQRVVELKGSNPRKPNDNGVMYVASTGRPYIVRIAGSGKSSFGVVNFGHFNQPVQVEPPAGAISITQLEQTG